MIPFLRDAMTPWVIHYLLYYLFYPQPFFSKAIHGAYHPMVWDDAGHIKRQVPFRLTYAYKRLPLSVQPLPLLHNIPSRLTFPSPPFCCTRLPPVPPSRHGSHEVTFTLRSSLFLFVTRGLLQSRVSIVSRQASVVDIDRGGHLVFKTDHNPLHL
jgi:hypothetical protein